MFQRLFLKQDDSISLSLWESRAEARRGFTLDLPLAKARPSFRRSSKTFSKNQPSVAARKLNGFAITDTLLQLIAAAAIMGLNKTPKNGYSNAAATGVLRY
ncbi:hypothetical protein TBK1r_42310 [Stieleria magnilauensis]|uniref:Uncharacterized protein n=1 Tax=Stieleria magnilauensis TaxID=2527963 RepID=A0ABX5XTC2_9BACT|nr:hypothetical protein TBK1r_42310 [Planctomycetes bacterium TBK1r]